MHLHISCTTSYDHESFETAPSLKSESNKQWQQYEIQICKFFKTLVVKKIMSIHHIIPFSPIFLEKGDSYPFLNVPGGLLLHTKQWQQNCTSFYLHLHCPPHSREGCICRLYPQSFFSQELRRNRLFALQGCNPRTTLPYRHPDIHPWILPKVD